MASLAQALVGESDPVGVVRDPIESGVSQCWKGADHRVPVLDHKALTPGMLTRAEGILSEVLRDWRCELVEFGGEADHVHLLFRGHPAMELSRLVNNLKTVSSRLLRKEFAEHLAKFNWKPVLWHGAYYVGTVGDASLETVRRYVETQRRGRWPGEAETR